MTIKRITLAFCALALLHNALRLLVALAGAPWGIFNYLTPFKVHLAAHAPVEAGALALAVALLLALIGRQWNRPGREHSIYESALWTLPTAAVASLFAVMVTASVERSYGLVMFVLVPFLTGFHATLALARRRRISVRDALAVSAVSSLLLGALLLAAAVEGLICVLMAAPLALVLSILGGMLGFAISGHEKARSPVTFLLLVSLAPFGGGVERALQPTASLFQVTTAIDIPASPERVWQTILQPARLAPPTHPLLRAGVGYPLSSHIDGAGASATRYCDFSTGKLVEPVLLWDEPHELRFTVASNPIPMQEWTPYAHLHPPHLDGFLVTRQGEFRLTPLPNGYTHLEAITWYQHHLSPEQYWRWWSDDIIHAIHGMVLTNIRDRAVRVP